MQHMSQGKDEATKYISLKIIIKAILLVKVKMPDRNCNYNITVFHTLDLFKTHLFIN